MNTERKTQVLILDDEPIVCKRLKPGLEKVGYEVEAFTRSAEAMDRVKEKDFDIVITDLKMEGLDGMQFLAEVKKHSPATEVIVITGFATMETAKESFKKGVFDFIAKPFKLGEIQDIVRKAEMKVRENR
jgi:DNA-binding NtrC family response regulator